MTASNYQPARFRSLLISFILFSSLFVGIVTLTPAVSADSGRTTGNEEITATVLSDYYERGSDISLVISANNLDPATEYTVTYTLCNAWVDYYEANTEDYSYSCDYYIGEGDEQANSVTGTVDIGSGNNFHVTTIAIADPGCCGDWNYSDNGLETQEGIQNESMLFKVTLDVQNVYLTENTSGAFVLGGEVTEIYIDYYHDNLLLTMGSSGSYDFELDYSNMYVLDYDVSCGLYDSATDNLVDSDSEVHTPEYSIYGDFELQPTAEGDHYVQCTLTREFDGAIIATAIGDTFSVIDEDITGNEDLNASLDAIYYDRGDSMTLTINASDLFVGTEYTVNYTLCNAWGDYYEENTEYNSYWCEYYIGEGDEQANTLQGEVSFIATTSSHTETITIADPGCCGDWNYSDNGLETQEGIRNQSMLFEVRLDVHDVYLNENESGAFVLGGEVTEIYIDYYHDNLLLTMGSSGSYEFELDYSNMYILDYDISCGLYDSATDNLVDSDSEVQAQQEHIYGDFELQPTTEGDHYVQCTLTREFDGAIIATAIGDTFSVISDEGNQDDASITVEVSVDPVEDWGTVSMLAIDLDAGQGYTINWMVTDDSPNGGGILMIANDHIWVAGSSGTEEYVLEFHDLSDTTNACISVTLVAGETELQTVSGVCWDSHSTSDFDGDGVYDKDDMCENTPSGTVVQANGCSDTDNDGWTDSAEIDCSTLVNDANSIPVDSDSDGVCDYLDTDDDNDGYMDEIELLSGTNPLDPNDYPANQLPVCSIHYSLEVDGIPMEITGEAVIPTLPVGTGVTPEITVPAGSYYLIAVCVDPDNDPITVTVNDVTVGPMTGEVKAGAIVVIEAGVDESVEATITWTDGTNSATTNVIVNLDGDMSGTGTGLLPGFTAMLGLVAMLGAALVIRTKPE